MTKPENKSIKTSLLLSDIIDANYQHCQFASPLWILNEGLTCLQVQYLTFGIDFNHYLRLKIVDPYQQL